MVVSWTFDDVGWFTPLRLRRRVANFHPHRQMFTLPPCIEIYYFSTHDGKVRFYSRVVNFTIIFWKKYLPDTRDRSENLLFVRLLT